MSQLNTRKPHAALDLEGRKLKALKIELLLGLQDKGNNLKILDIGTGSGGVASYFAAHKTKKYTVSSVDVCDSRKVFDGYDFYLVSGCALPFDNHSFDVVITNHVIEHVGELVNQVDHLREIRRVLKTTGVGYLAVPNRWMLKEPHYKLLFLSWLPKRLRTPYLRFMKKGSFYDCEPLMVNEIESMFGLADFKYENKSIHALKSFFILEKPNHFFTKIIKRIPDYMFNPFIKVIPTLIYIFK